MRHGPQSPRGVVMVRPHHFTPNPATASDNVFQADPPLGDPMIARRARDEVDAVADALAAVGVRVHLFDDEGTTTPDSVFPNNWFSTHHGGRVAIYPMYAPSRRGERRLDVIELLKREYRVQEVVDYSALEPDGLFLEGTGAMVFDHAERTVYVAASNRADPVALERFCTTFGYEPMVFANSDPLGRPIYHTNVVMSIATEFALVCTEVMTDAARRNEVVGRLRDSGRDVIDLSWSQVCDFAGNALEVIGTAERHLALSARAASALTEGQRETIERSCRLLPIAVPTLELAGGSVRCMLAGVHLLRRG